MESSDAAMLGTAVAAHLLPFHSSTVALMDPPGPSRPPTAKQIPCPAQAIACNATSLLVTLTALQAGGGAAAVGPQAASSTPGSSQIIQNILGGFKPNSLT